MRAYVSVTPGEGGLWRIRYPDATVSVEFPEKGDAINGAVAWAASHKPCEIWVFAENGELADVLIYE